MNPDEKDDHFYSYQCKQCPSKFKVTADLQQHIRLSHRKRKNTFSNQKMNQPLSEEDGGSASKEVDDAESNIIYRKNDHQLTCGNCHHKFDKSDVVLHPLRHCQTETGSWKCPFCVKVQLRNADLIASDAKNMEQIRINNQATLRESQRNEHNCITGKLSTITDSIGISSSPKLKPERNGIRKNRKKLIQSGNATSWKKSTTTPPPSLSSSSVQSDTPIPSPASELSSGIPHPESIFQSEFQQISYVLMHRKNRKLSENQGKSSHSSSADDESGSCSSNYYEQPVKVPVLINNNPISSQVPIPRRRQFGQEESFPCPYCDFKAKKIMLLRFHMNSHLAKSYPCEFCSRVYRDKNVLKTHKKKLHPDKMVPGNSSESPSSTPNTINDYEVVPPSTPAPVGKSKEIRKIPDTTEKSNNNQVEKKGVKNKKLGKERQDATFSHSHPIQNHHENGVDMNDACSNLSNSSSTTISVVEESDNSMNNFPFQFPNDNPLDLAYLAPKLYENNNPSPMEGNQSFEFPICGFSFNDNNVPFDFHQLQSQSYDCLSSGEGVNAAPANGIFSGFLHQSQPYQLEMRNNDMAIGQGMNGDCVERVLDFADF